MKGTDLIGVADQYLLARPCCKEYAKNIRTRAKWFAEAIGDREVTALLLNESLAAIEKVRKPATVRGYRTSIMALLNFARWTPDGAIRRLRVNEREVDCFTLDEIRELVKAGRTMQGELPHGMPLAVFWPLCIDSGYSTGLRFSDLMKVPAADVDDNGECRVTQSKTGRLVVVSFTPESLEVIRRHGQPRAVPWPFSYNHFRNEFRSLIVAAAVRPGNWKWIRRSAGSYAEQKKPGFGHRVLGNTRDIFRGHYWAFKTLQPQPLQPPRLKVSWRQRIARWFRGMLKGGAA